MEELRLLVEMVADLPHMALWVIAAFFAYKVIVVGSIYGVIRFIASGIFAVFQAYIAKPQKPVIVKTKDGFECVGEDAAKALSDLMKKVAAESEVSSSQYFHLVHARELSRAWDRRNQTNSGE